MKDEEKEKLNCLLAELGYTICFSSLSTEYQRLFGKKPTEKTVDWFTALAPHVAVAHQLGTEGRRLEEYYSFLRPIEVYHERDTNLRA